MKNPYLEQIKRAAKQSHQNSRSDDFESGILVKHLYDNQNAPALTWWDDVTFIMNDYRVAVTWIHPRMAYEDIIKDEAYKNIAHLYHDDESDLFADSTANYIKLGKSRKKIVSYTCNTVHDEKRYQALLAEKEKLRQANDYVIKPSIKVTWLNWCRYVDICAPIEVGNVDDLVMLVNLVKWLLKAETSLNHEFPDYCYTRQNWLEDGLAGSK